MPSTRLHVIVAIPVKPFDAAKQRLGTVLSTVQRRLLSVALARRTVGIAEKAGATPLVLSADDEVTEWASGLGVDVLADEGSSLDRASHGAVAWAVARKSAWAICHSDLPLVSVADLSEAVGHLAHGTPVIAPSSDGGTSLVGSTVDHFGFAYGSGSFHRHLARLARAGPVVIARPGLALDLDEPSDLDAARHHSNGAWLAEIVG